MIIGIDIDDTTVVTVKSMVKYGDKYDTEVLGREAKKDNLGQIKDRYYMNALYGWTEEEKFAFFDMYYKNVLEECYPLPNAVEMINKLKSEGNDIIFITARLTNIKNCNTENITKTTLEKYGIPYDKIILNVDNKLKFCKENGVEIFIDDSFDTCKSLQENGIKAYLMTTKMNINIETQDVERVTSWDEIYDKISNL